MLLADIIDKSIGVVVALILGMVFTTFFFPFVIGWEEGVCLGGRVVDLCQTETVCHRQGLLIDTGTTYYIDILLGRAVLEGFFEGGVGVAAGEIFLRAAQDDIPSVGQGTFGQ